jgi:hypothetical protein
MMLRLALISSAIPLVLFASDNAPGLSPFADAGKSLPQLVRESVDRQIAASVQGKPGVELASPLMFLERPRVMLPPRPRSKVCSIPLLESKVQHPERFRMQVLKVPARPMDHMATPAPAPVCEGRN